MQDVKDGVATGRWKGPGQQWRKGKKLLVLSEAVLGTGHKCFRKSGFVHYSVTESHNGPESNLDQSNSFWTLHWRCKNL